MRNTADDRSRNSQRLPAREAVLDHARGWKRSASILSLFWLAWSCSAQLTQRPDQGVSLARGFSISTFSNERQADDIQAMTLDSFGRVVVTGPGYIRTLLDANNDGVADGFVDFAATKTGGMGMCFEGPNLYFVGDGALWRFTDANGDGVADGPGTEIIPLKIAEHGAHALRQAPDGSWYLIAGNDSEIHAGWITEAKSPVRQPESGVLMRLTSNFHTLAIYAHGFRNPYDFDFNSLGDLFTYDSDVEREFLLPWYSPTRLYHVGYGGFHGWRLPGYLRGYARPDADPSVIPRMVSMGRGSPTGLACYRHFQFPSRYQGGFFGLDWTFGRVWFSPFTPTDGSTYQAAVEPFLEPIGTAGFAPTDVVVAPDGSLLISIGGRKTRGSVYRITYTAEPGRIASAANWVQEMATDVDAVLRAPQPLDAWSRAFWQPLAKKFGSRPFDMAATSPDVQEASRIRAIEILTELHGGLMTSTAQTASKDNSPFIRARVAWALGRLACTDFAPILLNLSRDSSPFVRRSALEAMEEQVEYVPAATVAQAALANASHPDKRLRQLAARLGTFLPLENWSAFYQSLMRTEGRAQLTCALSVAWRFPTNSFNSALATTVLKAVKSGHTPEEQLEAAHLLQFAMGDWKIHTPSIELYTAYEAVNPPEEKSAMANQIAQWARANLNSTSLPLVEESSRLLAMLRDSSADVPAKLLNHITPLSEAATDLHFLTVLSKLPSSTNGARVTERSAESLVGLARKLEGQDQRPKQTWNDRLKELAERLIQRDVNLAEVLVRTKGFVHPSNIILCESLTYQDRLKAGRLYFKAATENPQFPWSSALVRLISLLPPAETRPLLRAQWKRSELRDELLAVLAVSPDREDRDKFIAGLDSKSPEAVSASVAALKKIPAVGSPSSALEASLRALQRSLRDRSPTVPPKQVLELLRHLTGQEFKIQEPEGDLASIRQAYQPVMNWFLSKYPALSSSISRESQTSEAWERQLRTVRWQQGNPTAGEQLFNARACAACHGGTVNLGPDLSGVTRRWSPTDLFTQIKYPSREVAEPYRATQIQTKDGLSHLGLVAFFSADGILLRTADGRTERIAENDIVTRQIATDSIMPEGLLDGMSATDLSDLYAYLRTLDGQK